MNATEVARVLDEIATLGELNGENPFRTRAFANAARALEASGADLPALAAAGELTSIKGIGEGIAQIVRELVQTGRSSLYDELRAQTPSGLFELLKVPGLGAKRIHTLHAELGVETLDALEDAARAGRVAALGGFGAKTEQKLLEGVAFVRTTLDRRRYPQAMDVAARLLEWLRARDGVQAAEIVGALRRRLEVVEAVELLAASDAPAPLLAAFRALGAPAEGAGADEGCAEIRLPDGLRATLRCVPPRAWVAAVVWETGGDTHRAALAARAAERGLRLERDGLWRGAAPERLQREAELYAALGLQYVPPELREGLGELDAAAAGALPRLVELSDLRGTFHCHTTYSDGKATLAEMAEAARAKGWQYLGIADHSPYAAYAGGLKPAAVTKQHREIDAWNREHGGAGQGRFRLFKGTESDILPDGSLDYDADVLARFDYVVGSVHSGFNLSRREMTDRVLRAIENPHLTMLGHPTGRLLLGRSGFAIELDEVIDAAAAHGVLIEINADPHRLDLDWRHVRQAAQKGILIPVNPDAHSTGGLDNVAFGVNMARKGWLQARDVLNTWTLEEVEEFFAQRKQARTR